MKLIFTIAAILSIWFFFSSRKANKIHVSFPYRILDEDEMPKDNEWYQEKHKATRYPHMFYKDTSYPKDWKQFVASTDVRGISRGNRSEQLIPLLSDPSFHVALEREPDNQQSSAAVKVLAVTDNTTLHIGYLSKEIAEEAKDEPELDARTEALFLPINDKKLGLHITVLSRTVNWKKRQKKMQNAGD